MFEIFIQKILQNPEWKSSINLKVFLTLKFEEFDEYANSNGNGKGLFYAFRMMGRTIPEDKNFPTKDLIINYQKFRHVLVQCIRNTREFINLQIR